MTYIDKNHLSPRYSLTIFDLVRRLAGLIFLTWWVLSYTSATPTSADSTNIRKPCVFKTYPPATDSTTHHLVLRNQRAPFGRKFLRASGLVVGFEAASVGLLFALPKSVSNWDKSKKIYVSRNYKRAYSSLPIVDQDAWYINYLGHPYQGAYTYNSIRSQGAKVWQSSLFTVGHTLLWEYGIEASMEQPSIQDLVVTPAAGILLGELFHYATMVMAKNGFKWYEKAFVCVFNPMFAINNGFKFAQQKKPPTSGGF